MGDGVGGSGLALDLVPVAVAVTDAMVAEDGLLRGVGTRDGGAGTVIDRRPLG